MPQLNFLFHATGTQKLFHYLSTTGEHDVSARDLPVHPADGKVRHAPVLLAVFDLLQLVLQDQLALSEVHDDGCRLHISCVL